MKKLFNTTKKKAAAGVTCAVLVAGGGFVLADSDAGMQLKSWYNGQFNHAVDDASANVKDYYDNTVAAQSKDYVKEKEKVIGQVTSLADGEAYLGKKEIDKDKQAHLDELKKAKEEIVQAMDAQFDELTDDGIDKLNDAVKKYKELAFNDLTSGVNEAKDGAVDKVNKSLDKAAKNAQDELSKAIEDAKSDIKSELDKQTEVNTDVMKTIIDSHVISLTNIINNKRIDLKKQAIAAIGQASAEKVDAAKRSLDDIVNGMN